ncbi:MAG: hypothetical protein ACUVQ1_01775 [Candidatus Kapaibacteriales bacterium]
MKIKPLMLLLLLGTISLACSKEKFSNDEKKFMEIYKNILITRYTVEDSTIANKQINMLLQKNGFTLKSFYSLFWEIKKKDNQKFLEMMDTIHKRALDEVISHRKKQILNEK